MSAFPSDPAAAPENVVAVAYNATAIQVTFDLVPQTERNGIVTKYGVYYQEVGQQQKTFDIKVFKKLITELKPKTYYTVWVLAFTEKGAGPPSNKINIITPESPLVIQPSQESVPIPLTDVKKLSTGETVT